MHELNPPLVHRDLKSPNVFLTRRLDELQAFDWRQPLAKVGDFGLSIWTLGAQHMCVPLTRDDSSQQCRRQHALEHLTPTWAAPEVLSRQAYGTEADVYAVGIMLWELLTRQHPFADVSMDTLTDRVMAGERPVVPSLEEQHGSVVADYVALMQQCWQQDPDARPSIRKVHERLLQLCSRAAPELVTSLYDVSSARPVATQLKQGQFHDYFVERVERIEPPSTSADSSADEALKIERLAERRADLIDRFRALFQSNARQQATSAQPQSRRVHCLQYVGDQTFWLGLSDGSVLLMDEQRGVPCLDIDRHARAVNVLSYNRQQFDTVWSGASDGRVFVWAAQVHSLDQAVSAIYLRQSFTVVDCNLLPVRSFVGSNRLVHATLRNGRLYLYDDAHVGPSIAEVSLTDSILSRLADSVLTLATSDGQLWLQLRVAGQDDDEAAKRWLRAVMLLVRLHRNERWLTRLASSTQQNRAHVIGLESVGGSTWSLAQSEAVYRLTEWQLLEAQHGLDQRLHLEPGRSVTVDMSSSGLHPRLQHISKMLWVANDTMWLAAGSGIAVVDLAAPLDEGRPAVRLNDSHSMDSSDNLTVDVAQLEVICPRCNAVHSGTCSSSSTVQPMVRASAGVRLVWPDSTNCHGSAVQLMALVGSESGFEVWTYAHADEAMLVWQTGDAPVQIASVPLPAERSYQLRCLQQVNDSEVWAGTSDGTVVGWQVASRQPLPAPPLSEHNRHTNDGRPRDTVALAAPSTTPTSYVLSAGLESSLRRIVLVAQPRRQVHCAASRKKKSLTGRLVQVQQADTSAVQLASRLKQAFAQHSVSQLELYAVRRKLGSGCNGLVFAVDVQHEGVQSVWRQAGNERALSAAMKMQLPSHATTNTKNEEFKRERAALEDLPTHDNICVLYHHFNGAPSDEQIGHFSPAALVPDVFYAMNTRTRAMDKRTTQFMLLELHRTTLKEHLAEHRPAMSSFEVARLGVQLAAGLAHMFAHGWLHLDIKSDNLLLASDGRLVITDFGTSMKMQAGSTTLQFSASASRVGGNAQHLSPEALSSLSSGQPFDAAKQPSWELGCMLCELITGQEHPYPGYPDGYAPHFQLPPLDADLLFAFLEEDNRGQQLLTAAAIGALVELVVALLCAEPADRPSINAAKQTLENLLTVSRQ